MKCSIKNMFILSKNNMTTIIRQKFSHVDVRIFICIKINTNITLCCSHMCVRMGYTVMWAQSRVKRFLNIYHQRKVVESNLVGKYITLYVNAVLQVEIKKIQEWSVKQIHLWRTPNTPAVIVWEFWTGLLVKCSNF